MATKRPAPDDGSSKNSSNKRVHFEPCRIGPVSTQEEMDMKVLQFQNKKLAERLEQRQRQEADLRQRIEQLEKRQTSDEAVLCVVNRYWNQLNEDLRILLQRFDAETSDEYENRNENEATTSFLAMLGQWDRDELEEKLAQRVQVSTRAVAKVLQAFDRIVQRNQKIMLAVKGDPSSEEEIPSLDDAVRQANVELQNENKNLHLLVTGLHEKHHQMNLKFAEVNDKLAAQEIANAELRNHIEDLEYDLSKTKQREEKLDMHLSECLTKLKAYNLTDSEGKPPVNTVTQAKMEDLQKELEAQKELANNRLMELETLNTQHKESLKLVEKLKMDLQCLPEKETRNLMATSKNTHLRQIEQMESEELALQKKLRTEVIQLEDALAQVRKEYEMLRVEFEQNLAANEQTVFFLLCAYCPINREMRHLITSLQNHNHQLKGEVQRYKRKLKEMTAELAKLQPLANMHETLANIKEEPSNNSSGSSNSIPMNATVKEEVVVKKEKDDDHFRDEETDMREKGKSDAEIIRELKAQLKKSQEAQKELKLLLDMYKGAPKEQRDKAQLMAAEKKARAEVEELRNQIKKNLDNERKERRKLADEEALKKIKALEDQLQSLQKQLASQKQEEEALLNEMDITGQAFEDMQEQNLRLIQQLREKDDANFKLMSERIKSNQIHKLLREEKSMLTEQVMTFKSQVDAQNLVVRKLEEKESLRQQSSEMQKRKSIESAQSSADLRLHLEKYLSHLKEVQNTVAEKTSALQQEAFKTKRLQEDIISLRREVERGKKFELASTADEVLMEEIREYKEQLTCPSCKVKRKDAVLTKCFHVFCFDCLKTRYETRQRKCPKCNANFGANDFHRLYLA
ncbi:E3 ubiquitin-protein ligase Bre1 like protein [Argiope bruennichi]|uniref:E3 ubiquitin protein ligase n=1 Tax=Argiope bruennichi TaxID=94029 RepID=A0A8T0EC14_ARGBR|nr:E3 ubiquitin-protein ligase Bre1 like protein [Argiope bruennichi]